MAGTITHQWNGTILTISSDSGTSAMDLKGAKGDDGPRGPQGIPGDANLIDAVAAAEKAAADAETALSQLGTARDEAVVAAAQVKAIVAGNEAYTKAESDSRFANAIKPTATGEVAAAADSGNYPLQGLSIYGKTTQAGTPTPTSPIDLVNIGVGSIGVKVCGKNLIDISKASGGTSAGITVSINADGTYTINGTATDINVNVWFQGYFDANAPTLFTLPAGRYYVAGIALYSGIKYISGNYQLAGAHFTLTKETPITGVRCTYVEAGQTYSNRLISPIVAAEKLDMNYEPYKESGSITLNTPNGLPGIPVSSGGNYTDSTGQQWVADEIDLAAGVYRQRVIGKTINGSETITYDGDAFNIAGVFPADGKAYKYGLCSHYKIYTNYNEYIKYVNSMCVWGTGALRIRHGGSTDAAAFKLWLADNPITVYLPYTTPTETALTAAEIAAFKALQSQYPNTTVYSDANAGIAATYVADTKLYIDNKFNELSTALVAMGG